MTDYRELLKKYMLYVADCDGFVLFNARLVTSRSTSPTANCVRWKRWKPRSRNSLPNEPWS